jgi:hypothetical protein
MRAAAALVAGVLLLAGCGSGSADHPTARGWVAGIALTGRPICPTPTMNGELCRPTPRPHAVLTLTGAAGSRRVTADAAGRFRVALAPGRYSVRCGGARTVRVVVVAGHVAHIRVRA